MKVDYIGARFVNTGFVVVLFMLMLTISCSKNSRHPSHQADAPQADMSIPSTVIRSNTNHRDNQGNFDAKGSVSPSIVKLDAVELVAQNPYQLSLGNGRNVTITAFPDQQMYGRVAVKLVLVTTNSSVAMGQPRMKTETLQTTLLSGQPNILSLGGMLYVLNVSLKKQ